MTQRANMHGPCTGLSKFFFFTLNLRYPELFDFHFLSSVGSGIRMEFLHDGMTPDEAEEEAYVVKLLIDQAPTSSRADDADEAGASAAPRGGFVESVVNKTQRRRALLMRCALDETAARATPAGERSNVDEMPSAVGEDAAGFDGSQFSIFEPVEKMVDGSPTVFDIPLKLTNFGNEMKETQFVLLPEASFLNTASYGATPRLVLRAAEFYEDVRGMDPVAWQAFVSSRYDVVCDRLARFVGAETRNDVAMLANCNEGTSTVLKSLPWQVGTRLLILSCDYEATHLAAQWLATNKGVIVDTVQIALPGADVDILSCLDAHLQLSRRIGTLPMLANFCHVTSKTGFIFPIASMTALCHRYGIAVMVDGAQAPGHFALNVSAINAEFYVGTCHKWMFSCPGVAFIVTAQRAQPLIQPLAPMGSSSRGYYETFKAVACAPSCPNTSLWLSLWYSFEFVERVCGGWAQVYAHNSKLAQASVTLLRDMWSLHEESLALSCLQDEQVFRIRHSMKSGATTTSSSAAHMEQYTALLRQEPAGAMEASCCMPIVPLPRSRGCTSSDAVKLMGYLLTKYSVTAFLLALEFPASDGEKVKMLAVRLTLQVHTCIEDVQHLARAVRDLRGSYGALSVFKEYLPQVT